MIAKVEQGRAEIVSPKKWAVTDVRVAFLPMPFAQALSQGNGHYRIEQVKRGGFVEKVKIYFPDAELPGHWFNTTGDTKVCAAFLHSIGVRIPRKPQTISVRLKVTKLKDKP